VSDSIVVVIFASWVGCFWLGFQIGKGRSEQRRKAEVDDLERRFRIVDCEAVNMPRGESISTGQRGSAPVRA
jgi:hypothetical protein